LDASGTTRSSATWCARAGDERFRPTPVPGGTAYRVASPPGEALAIPEVADAVGQVLERFAREAGFGPGNRVPVGFRRGIFGHHRVGRAVDIYTVGGQGMDEWKRRWDRAAAAAARAGPRAGRPILALERRRNLGWRLYRALQVHGRWSRPPGHPVQLFGPWTREEGPWRRISDFLLRAHRDHIHVAR
jgi:hypothetical protein